MRKGIEIAAENRSVLTADGFLTPRVWRLPVGGETIPTSMPPTALGVVRDCWVVAGRTPTSSGKHFVLNMEVGAPTAIDLVWHSSAITLFHLS
jgi:hypothetical protein